MSEEPFALTIHAPQPAAGDYDTIHAAVMETARGRWFLQEYARRNRNADTRVLLAAIERIEAALRLQKTTAPAAIPGASSADLPLLELRDAIILTKENLSSIQPDGTQRFKAADFDRITQAIDAAAAGIRAAGERMQDIAWTMREQGVRDRRCEEIEAQARDIAKYCGLLDDTAAGAKVVAALLREIEDRIDAMLGDPRRPARSPERAADGTHASAPPAATAAPVFAAATPDPAPLPADRPQAADVEPGPAAPTAPAASAFAAEGAGGVPAEPAPKPESDTVDTAVMPDTEIVDLDLLQPRARRDEPDDAPQASPPETAVAGPVPALRDDAGMTVDSGDEGFSVIVGAMPDSAHRSGPEALQRADIAPDTTQTAEVFAAIEVEVSAQATDGSAAEPVPDTEATAAAPDADDNFSFAAAIGSADDEPDAARTIAPLSGADAPEPSPVAAVADAPVAAVEAASAPAESAGPVRAALSWLNRLAPLVRARHGQEPEPDPTFEFDARTEIGRPDRERDREEPETIADAADFAEPAGAETVTRVAAAFSEESSVAAQDAEIPASRAHAAAGGETTAEHDTDPDAALFADSEPTGPGHAADATESVDPLNPWPRPSVDVVPKTDRSAPSAELQLDTDTGPMSEMRPDAIAPAARLTAETPSPPEMEPVATPATAETPADTAPSAAATPVAFPPVAAPARVLPRPIQIAKPNDPLAPIVGLSDEEKIALFS